jgi:hypothetical protein
MSVHDQNLIEKFKTHDIKENITSAVDINNNHQPVPLTLIMLESRHDTDRSFDEMKQNYNCSIGNKELLHVACINNNTSYISVDLYNYIKMQINKPIEIQLHPMEIQPKRKRKRL